MSAGANLQRAAASFALDREDGRPGNVDALCAAAFALVAEFVVERKTNAPELCNTYGDAAADISLMRARYESTAAVWRRK